MPDAVILAITVAPATPASPKSKTVTLIKSKTIFNILATNKAAKGMVTSPRLRNKAA